MAFETLHHKKKKKKKGNSGLMTMNLDMSKAYDRVEWIFLEKMGFHEKWIGWIYECVSSILSLFW